jgi:TFIIF-interacting CTD phosphatase-like protein
MIKKLTERCEVVIFSRRREKSLAAFVKEIGVELFAGVLDRSFMTFREGKKIKDLDKLGINLNKTIILDLNFEKYFSFWKENCIPISKNDEESELQNIVKQI